MEISLIIKAPNQKVPDQILSCGTDWTVRKLKEHISRQYPTKPPVDEQRLIFAGAYLNDDAVLVDALRQKHGSAETDDVAVTTQHTVHLVCTQDAPAAVKPTPRIAHSVKNVDPASIVGEDGLRRRINSSGPSQVPLPSASNSATVPTPNAEAATEQVPVPTAGVQGYQTEAEAQQAYHAAMNWYMEQYRPYYNWYYRTYFGCEPPELLPPPSQLWTPASAAVGQDVARETPEAAPAQPPPEPRIMPPNNNMRIDAQGNAFLADDDEDGENAGREWDMLDWIYTIARTAVFLSIIYFYSNMFRFGVVVVCGFLLQYLHQALRRNNNNNNNNNHQPQQEEALQAGEAAVQQNRPAEPTPSPPPNAATEPGEVTTTPEEAAPRGLVAVWAFVSAFFASLFPEVPAN